MESIIIMSRARKNPQHPPEALLPSPTFPHLHHLQKDDPDQSLHHLLHHHSPQSPQSRSLCKPSPRLLLAPALLIAVAIFIFLPSPFSSTPFHGYSTSHSHGHAHYRHGNEESHGNKESDDFTLGGLLADNADTLQCSSRGVIHRLRRKSQYLPSPYLVSKLRDYEALHRKCGPGTNNFNRSAKSLQLDLSLKFQATEAKDEECKYVVWIANSGLGNRLISIASAFVYALLTGRVLVLDGSSDLSELLCEPFPGEISWFLPSEFSPLSTISFNESSPHRFGLHLEKGTILPYKRDPPVDDRAHLIQTSSLALKPSFLFSFVHLTHGYDFYDKLFFCEKEQSALNRIPWLFLKTNLYFLPSLYLYIPEFKRELSLLFPQTETIFHHVSRYLFFPSDAVWSWITRFYYAYLANASQVVGFQIRTFTFPPVAESYETDQILTCAVDNGLLPKTLKDQHNELPHLPLLRRNSTAVLVTSLLPDYSARIMELYKDYPTETGVLVSVFQPSHEVHQNTKAHVHNIKAWAEICLLSFSDKLITSPMSTFGYVAQGLAGIKPWVLRRVENGVVPSPACSQMLSMDPCFHTPPYYNCDGNKGDDTSQVLPYVKHCEDVTWGLKMFPS